MRRLDAGCGRPRSLCAHGCFSTRISFGTANIIRDPSGSHVSKPAPGVKVHGAGCASRTKSTNIAVSTTVNRPASGAASSGKLARTGHHYCHHRRSSAATAHWTASVSSCRCADVGGRAAPGAGQFAHLARAPDAGPANKGPNVRDYSSSGRRAGFQVSQCIKGVVPLEGLEPTTPSLRMMCSTS